MQYISSTHLLTGMPPLPNVGLVHPRIYNQDCRESDTMDVVCDTLRQLEPGWQRVLQLLLSPQETSFSQAYRYVVVSTVVLDWARLLSVLSEYVPAPDRASL